jgi:hypothetical protein
MTLNFSEFDYNKNLESQRNIFELCFPETKDTYQATPEHYTWKFHSFPSSPSSYEYVVTENDKLIGYYAAIPYQYKIAGHILTAGMVCDVMTHPDARGKGIFTKIGHYATNDLQEKGIHFSTGYPIRPEVIPGHIKVGWNLAFKLPIYMMPIKSNGILRSKKLSLISPIVNIGISIYYTILKFFFCHKGKLNIQEYSTEEFLRLDIYEDFFSLWSQEQNYYLIKNKEFLKWRLGAKGTDYKIFCILDNDQSIQAMAITRKTKLEGVNTLAILDLMFLKTSLPLANSLCDFLRNKALNKEIEIIASMLSVSCAKKYNLMKSGFLKSPFIFTFITKLFNIDIPEKEFTSEENWHLMWIDSDDL